MLLYSVLFQMRDHSGVVGNGHSPSGSRIWWRRKFRYFRLHPKQRVDLGEDFGVEERWTIHVQSLSSSRFRRLCSAHTFHYGPTAPRFLRVRFDYSKHTSVVPDASYVLDSNNWRRQNNSRYLFAYRAHVSATVAQLLRNSCTSRHSVICLFVCLFLHLFFSACFWFKILSNRLFFITPWINLSEISNRGNWEQEADD